MLCTNNFQSLASTVSEINRGSHIFSDAPLAQAYANFGPKRCFFGKIVPNPSCVPNLKLLALPVAKNRRGSHIFWMLPWTRPPPILVLNVVFGKLVPSLICVSNLKLLASTVAEISRGSQFFWIHP